MDYVKTPLRDTLSIRRIVTVHYFEYARNYLFEGEKHDFWEFLYVDKGEVEVMADDLGYQLHQGDIIFHRPNEFHNVWANGKSAPNLVVVAFECTSPAMAFFSGRILRAGDTEKHLMASIVREAGQAFVSRLSDPDLKQLEPRPDAPAGAEQMLRLHLEHLLIHMLRTGEKQIPGTRPSSSVRERSLDDMTRRIIAYLETHVCDQLTFDDVCRFSALSRTYLKVMFKDKTGQTVMEYFRNLKIEAAQRMIREGTSHFSGIAETLGYASIHYFSRHFKKATGMTPSEYASSVKVQI